MSAHSILLVEDDHNDVFFFRRAAELAGLQNPIHVARDGREVTAYLSGTGEFGERKNHPLPALVIMDLNLIEMPGLEVLKWIRQESQCPAVPVIVLTSSSSDLDVFAAYRAGANSFLIKPSDPDQLIELLKVIQRYWFECCQLLPRARNP